MISTSLSTQLGRVQQWALLLGAVFVCPPWIWLAVRTRYFLEAVTRHSIPYKKRTVWLIKVLATVIAAGCVAGVLASDGVPWFPAVLPAGVVIFFSLVDHVHEIVPSKPPQEQPAYEAAWQEYWRLRRAYLRSLVWFPAAFLALAFVMLFTANSPQWLRVTLVALCATALLTSMVVGSVRQWKWLHWRCPRCGCAFRGVWGRFWLPKHCVYCGLPRSRPVD